MSEFIFVTEQQNEIVGRVAIRKEDISVVVEENILDQDERIIHSRTQISLWNEDYHVFAIETFDEVMKQLDERFKKEKENE